MGTKFSSKKDFNRVLATQPRSSITMPRFYAQNYVEKSNTDSLTIPAPMRFSHGKHRKGNRTTTISARSSTINESIQPLTKSNRSIPIERVNIPAVVNNQISQKSENERPQDFIVTKDNSFSNQLDSFIPKQIINGDAAIVSRSIINQNNQQQKQNLCCSSRNIVQHNGKQYLTELRERTERRYVQCFDESTQQMRLFEVNDYIPYRIVRPYGHTNQFAVENSQISNGWSDNHVNRLSDYSSQDSINVPSISFSQSTRPATTRSFDHYPQYSQPKFPQSRTTNPKYVSDQYLLKPSSFRAHTHTISDGRSSYSTSESFDSDEGSESDDEKQGLRSTENINGYYPRHSTPSNSYKQNNGYTSLMPVDLFARSSNTNDHHYYRKRSNTPIF